jgi:hypothetical protein
MSLDFVRRLMFLNKGLSKEPNRVGAAIILPEDGNKSSSRNAVFLRNIRRWKKSKNMILSTTPIRLFTERRSQVVSIPVSYLGGAVFSSHHGDRLS